jgi:Zinc finger, C3HC4 type (RING finger)
MEHFICPICLDTVAGARVAMCGHVFCGSCYYDMAAKASTCAVCRAPLQATPYPSYSVDSLLDAQASAAFRERVRVSRTRAAEVESTRAMVPAATSEAAALAQLAARLLTGGTAGRCGALTGMLRVFQRITALTCRVFEQPAVLRRIIACGAMPASREELTQAWRVLAHMATYFSDAHLLIAAGVAPAAIDGVLSREATVASRRAIPRVMVSLASTHPTAFHAFLAPPVAEQLMHAAPAVLAHVSLAVDRGVERLAETGLLAYLVPVLGQHERALDRALLTAMLDSGDAHCRNHARRAASIMLCTPVTHATLLAAVTWRDTDVAIIFATLHGREVERAVMQAAACDDFDAQTGFIDFLHALHDQAAFREPAVAIEVLTWMRSAATDETLRTFGMSYVSACCRESVACAAAVAEASGSPQRLLMPSSECLFYLAGDVFSHEPVAETHAAGLDVLLRTAEFRGYPSIYFASALAQHPVGQRLIRERCIERIRALAAECDDPVTAETAEGIVQRCKGGGAPREPPPSRGTAGEGALAT